MITNPFTGQTLVDNAWSEEARKASAEARKMKSLGRGNVKDGKASVLVGYGTPATTPEHKQLLKEEGDLFNKSRAGKLSWSERRRQKKLFKLIKKLGIVSQS